MIKYVLIAFIANSAGNSTIRHEFNTWQACRSAEQTLNRAEPNFYVNAACITDDTDHPTYTNVSTDKRTDVAPIFKDDDPVGETPPDEKPTAYVAPPSKNTSSSDVTIHQSNDDLPSHKE